MKLTNCRLLCACALVSCLQLLNVSLQSAIAQPNLEKRKQDPVKRVWSPQPSAEPVTDAAKSLARTLQGCIGAGLTKQVLVTQRGTASKMNVLGQGARFAVNDAKADGNSPVSGRVLTPSGDLYVSYLPIADGVVGLIEAYTRLPTKSKADKKRRAELDVVGFRLNKVVEFYQFAFWPKRSSASLATIVSETPEFVSGGVSPVQAAKLLSMPKRNAKGKEKEPLTDVVPPPLALKCGTVDPSAVSPALPSGGGSNSSCNAASMAELSTCAAIMCVMPPPGVQSPPGTGCCCASNSNVSGPGGDTGGGNSPGGGVDTTSCERDKMICVKPAPGSNYTGPDCYCPGKRPEGDPQAGEGEEQPITAPGFRDDPRDPNRKIGNDPWCKPSCGDGQCSGDRSNSTDPLDTSAGSNVIVACPESPATCPQDCNVSAEDPQQDIIDEDEARLRDQFANRKPECGNGLCEDVTCSGVGCPEAETRESCPRDCRGFLGVDPAPSFEP